MNRLLIDSNIVLDLLAKRDKFYDETAELFSLADKKKIGFDNFIVDIYQHELHSFETYVNK